VGSYLGASRTGYSHRVPRSGTPAVVDTPTGTEAPAAPSTDDRTSRDAAAWALKVGGASYRQIAEELGFTSPSRAHAAVKRANRTLTATDKAVSAQLIEEAVDQLFLETTHLRRGLVPLYDQFGNQVMAAGRPVYEKVSHRTRVESTRAALMALDMKARLTGVYAPIVQVVEVKQFTEQALNEHLDQLRDLMTAAGIDVDALEARIASMREAIDVSSLLVDDSALPVGTSGSSETAQDRVSDDAETFETSGT